MKKVLLAIFLVSISCGQNQADFHGLGGLNIGTNFTLLPISKDFRNVMEDEYYAQRFKLSEQIGSVSDLNITTDNGKISEVKFSSNEGTSIAELDRICKGLEEVKPDSKMRNKLLSESFTSKGYITADEQIFLMVMQRRDQHTKNGLPIYEYSYISKDAFTKNIASIIGKMGMRKKRTK